MNALPEHRRAINVRTWGRIYSASDYDPISVHQATHGLSRVIVRGIVVLIAVLAAVHFVARMA